MDNEEVQDVEETLDLPDVVEGEEDSTDWKAEAEKLRTKAIAQRERTKSYKAKLAEKDAAIAALATGSKKAEPSKTDGLTDAQLDFFELKGFTEPEEVTVFERLMQRTGMSHREALKDEWALSQIGKIRDAKEVKQATPSSSKRGGGSQGNDIAAAIAKYEQSGYDPKTLPTDFETQTAVINAVSAKTNNNKPAWKS